MKIFIRLFWYSKLCSSVQFHGCCLQTPIRFIAEHTDIDTLLTV